MSLKHKIYSEKSNFLHFLKVFPFYEKPNACQNLHTLFTFPERLFKDSELI